MQPPPSWSDWEIQRPFLLFKAAEKRQAAERRRGGAAPECRHSCDEVVCAYKPLTHPHFCLLKVCQWLPQSWLFSSCQVLTASFHSAGHGESDSGLVILYNLDDISISQQLSEATWKISDISGWYVDLTAVVWGNLEISDISFPALWSQVTASTACSTLWATARWVGTPGCEDSNECHPSHFFCSLCREDLDNCELLLRRQFRHLSPGHFYW